MSKLFTDVLNKRIAAFCDLNNSISDAQFGFRKGKSTVDALVELWYLNKKNDYIVKMAYDCIHRNAMWLKLYKLCIDGNILRIVKDMYEKVKYCVRSCNNYSQFFEYAVGLRQGEVISPILFSLFVEDLELFLQNDVTSGLSFDDILLILLLFADDMVILVFNYTGNVSLNQQQLVGTGLKALTVLLIKCRKH